MAFAEVGATVAEKGRPFAAFNVVGGCMRTSEADGQLSAWATPDEPQSGAPLIGTVLEFPHRADRARYVHFEDAGTDALSEVVGTKGVETRGRRPFPHPFPARMPLEVARAAVANFSKPGDVVLDPMCGSGVVARAAQLERRNAIGRDVDPLAVYLSRAICSTTQPADYLTLCRTVLGRAQSLAAQPDYLATRRSALPAEDQAFISYWFTEPAATELFALAEALDDLPATPSLLFAAVTFSSCIISRSGGASMAMDLSRSRPHRVATRKPRLPFQLWERNSASFSKYLELATEHAIAADIRLGDARDLDIEDDSVDAVITSPPYVNAIDYLRTSKFTLVFFGHELSVLRTIRSSSVGTERGLATGKLPQALEVLVDSGVAEERRKPLLRRYVHDMLLVLQETARVLRPGGRALFVVGPSILSRREYDGAQVLAEIAEAAGLEVVGHDRRDLSSTNRSLPPPNRNRRSASIHKRMTCELYVALRKPK